MELERPLCVLLAFQANRRGVITGDASVFDTCNLQNARLFINNKAIPYESLEIDYGNNNYSTAYIMFCSFLKNFYGKDDCQLVSRANFKSYAPIICFDCSASEEMLKSTVLDLRIEMQFRAQIPENTSAYAMIYHDKIVSYNAFNNMVM